MVNYKRRRQVGRTISGIVIAICLVILIGLCGGIENDATSIGKALLWSLPVFATLTFSSYIFKLTGGFDD